jgi:hypothetical protein
MTRVGQAREPMRDAVRAVRVERATGPFCRATSPTAKSDLHTPRLRVSSMTLGGKLPPRTAKLAVPPKPVCSLQETMETQL